METDYQQDYIAQTEPNQDEYQQIQYLYSMLYQVSISFDTYDMYVWHFICNLDDATIRRPRKYGRRRNGTCS